MRLSWKIVGLVLLAVLLSACGSPVTTPSSNPAPEEPSPTAPAPQPEEGTPSATTERPLAASVNGEPIYLVDYQRQLAQYEAAMANSGVDPTSSEGQERLLQAREQILNWMIEQKLMEQAAAEQGIVVTDEEVNAVLTEIIEETGGEEAFQSQIEQEGMTRQDVWDGLYAELIGAAVIDQVTGSVPETAEHVHARHILVDTREEAERLLARLEAGDDFAELARAHSQDESTKDAGGDLGFFPRGVLMATEVEEAAFALQPGQISPVVESSFGFHIVQVTEREPDRPLSPENLQHLRERAFQQWIESLWAEAEIERFVSQPSD